MERSLYSFIKTAGIAAAVLVAIYFYSPAEGAGWEKYNEQANTINYYDTGNIRRPSRDIVAVRTKIVPKNDKGRTELIQDRAKYNQRLKGYDKFRESVNLLEIKCSDKKIRILSVIDYNTEGKILNSIERDNASWFPIMPTSVGAFLFDTLCRKGKSK